MKPYIATTIIALALCSCQKIVHLNLNTLPPQIVIQGQVTDTTGPYTVTINQSVNFYASNTFPPVSGAVVKISDSQGVTDSLTEASPGTYITHTLQGKPGNTYTLTVLVQNTTYTAVSTMPQPVNFDSLTFQTSTLFGKIQTDAVVNYQDPPGIKNYYQFIEYINGTQFTKTNFIADDRLSDGKYIHQNLYTDSAYLNTGYQLKVTMNCIDANVWEYFYQLNQSSGSGAFNTAASPADPASNISNGALGYFSANTMQSKTVVVP